MDKITIFTIGFTKKTAEEFFSLLTKAGGGNWGRIFTIDICQISFHFHH